MNTNKKKYNNQESKKVLSEKTWKTGFSKNSFISKKLSTKQTIKRHLSVLRGTGLTVGNLVVEKPLIDPLVIDKPLVKKCFYEQCLKVLDPDF